MSFFERKIVYPIKGNLYVENIKLLFPLEELKRGVAVW